MALIIGPDNCEVQNSNVIAFDQGLDGNGPKSGNTLKFAC